ncbi:MAG: caspase family protein [Propionivibrio sp.]|nr:caspase family protein [Propionivibrio sp.]
MYNLDATQANIRLRLKALREARPEDVVVIYLAGHGETLNEDWMFILRFGHARAS